MAIYFLLFFAAAILAISNMKPSANVLSKNFNLLLSPASFLLFICLVIFIGLRHETGGDWGNYIYQLQKASMNSMQIGGDPLYQVILNYAASFKCEIDTRECAFNGRGLQFLNLVCAIFFCFGLMVFCNHQPRPWLALCVAIPYLVIVVGIGYTRQAAALGLVMLAYTAISQGRLLQYCFWIFVGASIHKTAIVMLPFLLFAAKKNKSLIFAAGTIIALVLYYFFFIEVVRSLFQNYIGAEYDSAGALIRIGMNAIPAIIFLYFRDSFALNDTAKNFWSAISYSALILFLLYFISPSSTAIDRIGLYLIPLQLLVLSRLPDALGTYGARNPKIHYLIVMYSALVLIVWIFFSSNAANWIPYQSFIWVLLGIVSE